MYDGVLSSGLPWVIGGEPARWRVGRPKGGLNGISKTDALQLELWTRQAVPAPSPASPLLHQGAGPVDQRPGETVTAENSTIYRMSFQHLR